MSVALAQFWQLLDLPFLWTLFVMALFLALLPHHFAVAYRCQRSHTWSQTSNSHFGPPVRTPQAAVAAATRREAHSTCVYILQISTKTWAKEYWYILLYIHTCLCVYTSMNALPPSTNLYRQAWAGEDSRVAHGIRSHREDCGEKLTDL